MGKETNISWTDSLIARFWSYVEIREPNECWPWKGGTFERGYGQFRAGKKKVRANRCAYELVKGPLGDLNSLHECDNPPCCNPAHLFKGSLSDNSKDRNAKGRAGACVLKPMRGEENPAAKLCSGQVLEIRALRQAGRNYGTIARQFNVSPSQIANIVRRKSWAELQA